MESFELSQKIAEKLDACPNCQGKIVQTGKYNVECPQCGMKLEIETGKRRKLNYAASVGLYAFMGGMLLVLVLQLIGR